MAGDKEPVAPSKTVRSFVRGQLQVCTIQRGSLFGTAIRHPTYYKNNWIVVQRYRTKLEAELGHDKWVKLMTAGEMPMRLVEKVGKMLVVHQRVDQEEE